MKNILLIVDPQNDFITGTLPVAGAEEKMKLLAQYLQDKAKIYDYICITLDSHTERHCSFTENGIKLLYYSDLDIRYPYEVFTDKQLLLNEIKKQL